MMDTPTPAGGLIDAQQAVTTAMIGLINAQQAVADVLLDIAESLRKLNETMIEGQDRDDLRAQWK